MGVPKLFVHDLARGYYGQVSSVPDVALSAKNAVDGDPASIYAPGAASAVWTLDMGGSSTVRGYALANHNLIPGSGTVKFEGWNGSAWVTIDNTRTVATSRDLGIEVTPVGSCMKWRLSFTNGATAIKIGCISILTDYGYNAAGVLTSGSGLGAVALEDEGGLELPISSVSRSTGIVGLGGPTGFRQLQRVGFPDEVISITIAWMKGALDSAGWKIWNAYYPPRADQYCNTLFFRGAWLFTDEWSLAVPNAYYVTGIPEDPMAKQVAAEGGRIWIHLSMRVIPREPVA
jgi:hypothetical protein